MKQVNWTRVLVILLVILASLALLYVVFLVVGRFAHAVILFVVAAVLAYVLTPVVNRLQVVFRARWAAVVVSYLLVVILIIGCGALLVTPFIQQSQSLVDNLKTPSAQSLAPLRDASRQADTVKSHLVTNDGLVALGAPPGFSDWSSLNDQIDLLAFDINLVKSNQICSRAPCNRASTNGATVRVNPNVTSFPSSYTQPMIAQANALQAAFTAFWIDFDHAHSQGLQRGTLTGDQAPPITPAEKHQLDMASQRASALLPVVQKAESIISASPILLLRIQSWLDDHAIKVDVHDLFGQAEKQISNQGSTILGNAITILQTVGNLLLDLILILIIAFFFLLDGRHIIRGALRTVPERYEEQVWYFVLSLDKVMGGYIRGTIFLAGLAGALGGIGAAILGVPYAILIGFTTFLLNMVPIIGPLVVYLPAVGIALFFTNAVTTVILLVWFIVFQQVVTNIMGPRVMGHAVGVHPLEAIAAVLIGLPLGGLLGAFLAVPLAGAVHILVRELYAYWVRGEALPTAPISDLEGGEDPASHPATPRAGPRSPSAVLDPPASR